MRCAIYARYSSDIQSERSLVDQIAEARAYAAKRGWTIVGEFGDAAISGAIPPQRRPEMLNALRLFEVRKADILLTESLDRISRDQEGVAFVYKHIAFADAILETLADGPVGPMHVGLKGTMAAMFLADLGQKVRRGQVGRVKAGRIPTNRCFGYRVTSTLEERGLREVDPVEAAIVRRIFAAYISGRSPSQIAKTLNGEGIASPYGRTWRPSTILGDRQHTRGIIRNDLYRGLIVYGRTRNVRDPRTGKVRSRPAKDEVVRNTAPELRIIDDETWNRAQEEYAHRSTGAFQQHRRPRHVFSGLVSCAMCGSPYQIVTRDYLSCAGYKVTGCCSNARMISTRELGNRVLATVRERLLAPEAILHAVEAFRREAQVRAREAIEQHSSIKTRLDAVERAIAQWQRALEAGADPVAAAPRYNELVTERGRLRAALDAAEAPAAVELHPRAAKRYVKIVEDLVAALRAGGDASGEAIQKIRALVRGIVVSPTPRGTPVNLKILGDINLLMTTEFNRNRRGKAVTLQ